MTNRLVSLAALVVATGALMALTRSGRRRAFEAPRAKPRHEQTWEGEGGALPTTGAQMGPDPALGSAGEGSEGLATGTRQDTIPGIH